MVRRNVNAKPKVWEPLQYTLSLSVASSAGLLLEWFDRWAVNVVVPNSHMILIRKWIHLFGSRGASRWRYWNRTPGDRSSGADGVEYFEGIRFVVFRDLDYGYEVGDRSNPLYKLQRGRNFVFNALNNWEQIVTCRSKFRKKISTQSILRVFIFNPPRAWTLQKGKFWLRQLCPCPQ